MVTAASGHDDGGMTNLTNLRTEHNGPRRTRGFAWELLHVIAVATIFNAVALAAVAVASGLAAPVQALIGVSVLAMLMAAFSALVEGLRLFGQPNGSPSRRSRGRPGRLSRGATPLGMRPRTDQ
jgi:hypothetical protein